MNASISNVFWAYDRAGASIIPSWLEGYIGSTVVPSNTINGSLTYWLKITATIPAGATQTVYMIFADRGTTVWDGTLTGIAPQWTSTYGQYDNGTSVFNFYVNFAGSLEPLNINYYVSYGNITFNNGVTIEGVAKQVTGFNGIVTSSSFSVPIIVDYYGSQSTSPSGDKWGWNSAGFSNNFVNYPWYSGTYTTLDFEGGINASPKTSQGGTSTNGTLSTPSNNLFPTSIWTHIYTSSTYYTYQNYTKNTGYITGASNTASLYFGIGVGNNEGSYASNGMTVYWIRARAYPPNGVMPTVLF